MKKSSSRKTTGKKKKVRASEMALKKKSRHLDGVKNVDLDDASFLQNFITDYGKILPARLTGANAKQQRRIKHGVRRARNVGLLP